MITLDPELLEILACPSCRSALRVENSTEELACTNPACGLIYPVRDEIPVLLVPEARGGPEEEEETGTDGHGDGNVDDDRPD